MIDVSNLVSYWLLGSAGALFAEFLKLYELYGKLEKEKFAVLFKSATYWLVFAGMCVASGFFAWVFNADVPNQQLTKLVISGLAANAILKKLIEARVASTKMDFGGKRKNDAEIDATTKITARDLFA